MNCKEWEQSSSPRGKTLLCFLVRSFLVALQLVLVYWLARPGDVFFYQGF
jgi:hypothetical protein